MGYDEMYKVVDIIISTILTTGFIFTIKDIKDILKEESIWRFLLGILLSSLIGVVLNIIFSAIFK